MLWHIYILYLSASQQSRSQPPPGAVHQHHITAAPARHQPTTTRSKLSSRLPSSNPGETAGGRSIDDAGRRDEHARLASASVHQPRGRLAGGWYGAPRDARAAGTPSPAGAAREFARAGAGRGGGGGGGPAPTGPRGGAGCGLALATPAEQQQPASQHPAGERTGVRSGPACAPGLPLLSPAGGPPWPGQQIRRRHARRRLAR